MIARVAFVIALACAAAPAAAGPDDAWPTSNEAARIAYQSRFLLWTGPAGWPEVTGGWPVPYGEPAPGETPPAEAWFDVEPLAYDVEGLLDGFYLPGEKPAGDGAS